MSTLFGLLAFLLFVLIHPFHLADGHLQSPVESTDPCCHSALVRLCRDTWF